MEVVFSELKQKDVVNLFDGKHLGKVCDLTFVFPEGKIKGFTVTGGKGFRFTRQEEFIPLKSVVKIGEDAVLVNLGDDPPLPPPPPHGKKNCPPICPPACPPPYAGGYPPPPYAPPPADGRRSFDEYE